MAILRETRAKIDPALLKAMKDHISTTMPHLEQEMAARPPERTAPAPKLGAGGGGGTVAPEKKYIPPVIEDAPALSVVDDSSEPVDKQKIAQIVVNYMKHKDSGVKH